MGMGSKLRRHTERGGAVLTGSQIYGTPTEGSDVDLVVLADETTQVQLAELLGTLCIADPGSGRRGGLSLRVGKLNLILTSRPQEVEDWRQGTYALEDRKPVTREEAVDHLRACVGDD